MNLRILKSLTVGISRAPPAGTENYLASLHPQRAHLRRASGVGCMLYWATTTRVTFT